MGPRPSTGPGEPGVAGPGLGCRGGTRRRALDYRLDSTICETYGLDKEGARHHGYTGKRGYHPLLAIAAGALRIGVVDAVATGQRGGHQRHHLVTGVGSAFCMAQVQAPVNQLGQAKAQGEGGRKNQPGIGHQAVIVEGDADAVGLVVVFTPKAGPVGVLVLWDDYTCERRIIP